MSRTDNDTPHWVHGDNRQCPCVMRGNKEVKIGRKVYEVKARQKLKLQLKKHEIPEPFKHRHRAQWQAF